MCGIIGIKKLDSDKEFTLKNAFEMLKILEYRGYDSFGYYDGDQIIKRTGKIEIPEIDKKIRNAILHTRWSTHGGVTEENSHPHFSNNGKIGVVHNGIIENFQELRKKLKAKGYKFSSETDTEVIPILIEDYMKEQKEHDFAEAVRLSLLDLEGSYAIAVMNKDEEIMIAAKKDSPLVLGTSEDAFFIASDVPPLLAYTRNVIFLEDMELAILGEEIKIISIEDGKPAGDTDSRIQKIEWSAEQAMKGEFEHFMLKEIYEQPEKLKVAAAISNEDINKFASALNCAFGSFFVACGTAYHACLAASYLFSNIAKKHVNLCYAHEFPSYQDFITKDTVVVPISQSGETADVIDAVKSSKKCGAKIYPIVNVLGSSLDRMADFRLYIKAGPEIGVASTKAYTNQLAINTMLAYACAGQLEKGKELVRKASEQIAELLKNGYSQSIRNIAESIKDAKSIFVIGRELNYPTALEAALKIKEISYIHAEGFAGGELKHGAIALIEDGTPCIVFAANDKVKKEILSNAMELKSRGGIIIGIAPEDNEMFNYWIPVPDIAEASHIVNVVPAQLLAYHLAVLRKCDPDKPRNLAKSVTVK